MLCGDGTNGHKIVSVTSDRTASKLPDKNKATGNPLVSTDFIATANASATSAQLGEVLIL